MKKLVYTAGIAILLATVLLGGLSQYMLNYSLSPEANRADTATDFAEFRQRYPDLSEWLDSVRQEGILKDTTITFANSRRHHALYMTSREAQGRTAIIVHGYKDCATKFLNLAYMYHHDLGYNVLLPDLYAHGLTEGHSIQMGWKDTADVAQWRDIADKMFSDSAQQSRICLHGTSMGAATIMNMSRHPQPESVKAFVADCGYTSVWDEFALQLKEEFSLPPFPLLYTSSLLCNWKYGWNFTNASPLESVKHCRLPMLFIHGTNDDFVPTYMIHQLYEAKPEPKSIWLVPNAGHAQSYRVAPEDYTHHITDFLTPII